MPNGRYVAVLSLDLPAGRFAFRIDRPADAPMLFLSNSQGTDHTMWDRQMATIARHFRVLRYDSRGHGASVVPPSPYTIEMIGQDAPDLCNALAIYATHFCGLSIGGMVDNGDDPRRALPGVPCGSHG